MQKNKIKDWKIFLKSKSKKKTKKKEVAKRKEEEEENKFKENKNSSNIRGKQEMGKIRFWT